MYKRSMTRKNNSMRSSQRGMRCGGCGAEDEPEAGSDAGTEMGAGLTVSVDDDDSGCCCIRLLLPAVPDVIAPQSFAGHRRHLTPDAESKAPRGDIVLQR
jgi:hypothetical protein